MSRSAHKPTPADLNAAFAIFNEIGIIAQLSTNQMQRSMPHGLTQSQFAVLNWFIRVDDQATPGRLAKAFQVTKGAMTNTLGKLSDKGFISIAPDPDSGRSKLVHLTPSGRKAREDALAATYPQLEAFLAQFPLAQLQQLLPLLRRVRQYLDTAREEA
jgi:DNA-binding MarR family transcriptional regulator